MGFFGTDFDTQQLFNNLQGQARAAAAAAVNGAAEQARRELPSLGDAARAQLAQTLDAIHLQATGAITQDVAHAVRAFAQNKPELQAQLNDIARQAGMSGAQGAINEGSNRSQPWLIAGLALAALAVAATAVYLARADSDRELDRQLEAKRLGRGR